ncbi:neuronal acetylcholine receptor subunit alpha-7 [Plakobranchus ocellatus]|uniref:Neuronal acetylcholine receptor subunit alpha-7 n=1 Tax=Plakobranchus ocellatus TaxID=259542 RepID=A0AAV3ZBC9_9GAST|nr:neuronal acetylcholine receptor subunit alpha-7 [Plakobranchus ocellatus]
MKPLKHSFLIIAHRRGSVEKELIRDLLTQYEYEGRLGRPVVQASDMVMVNFSLSLIQILDVDEKNQVLKTNIWYHYKWRDIFLQWTPEKHENITSIRVPSNKIWLPDILLYNFADDRLKEQRDALVVVEYTGDLLWMPQAILNSSCAFDILFFPFDEQTCSLKFGSWTYDGNALNMDFVGGLEHMDMSDYVQSNEWDVVENVGVRNVKYYTCCPEPYPDMTFTLRLKRKVAFYTFILILPCGLLSLLTMVIFWVPPESPAKLQLGMNIFLAFFVLLLLLADYTPRAAASIPLIGAYFCLSMIMITLSTVLACVVANMYFRGIRINRAPRWLRSCIIDTAARMFCVQEVLRERRHQPPTTPRKMWSTYVTGVRSQSDPETLVAKTHLLEARPFNRRELRDYGAFQEVTSDFCDPDEPSTSTAFNSYSYSASASPSTSDEAMLVDEVACIREMMEEDEAYQESLEQGLRYTQEWRMIACVMDRIFFTFYIIVNFLGLLGMYIRSLFS